MGILGSVRWRGPLPILAAALLCAGCGESSINSTQSASSSATTRTHVARPGYTVHPQAVEPVAGAAGAAGASPAKAAPRSAGVSVSTPGAVRSLARPQSTTAIRRELSQSGMTASTTQATLTSGGLAVAPIGAPAAVQEVIAAGNQIAHLPYIWGGGHMTYEDTGYDCSGSISYVFAAARLLDHTVTSGQLESWGSPGPGKWITVFANAGHTFMYVAGLRFDTVALAETGSRWSNRTADEPDISTFTVRHPAGL